MRLLLIFALTFTLSAQQDNKTDGDAESTDNAREIMKKFINGIGEEAVTKLTESLKDDDLDKLTECIQSVCEIDDFVGLMQKILSVLQRTLQDDTLIYQWIKSSSEMMANVMNGIGEEMLTKVMESLNDDDLDKLTECIESDCELDCFLDLMQKMLNVLKGISHGEKPIYQLMKAFIKQGPLAELAGIFTNRREMDIPYHHPVSGGLHPGMSVYMQGTVPKESKRFHVDFARGQRKRDDILLHLSPRINNEDIVLGTFLEGRWGNVEKHTMSLRKGEHFEMIFLVHGAGYQILVNGSLLCSFKHKMHPRYVQDICADGEVTLQFLTVMGGHTMGNLGLPYYHAVPGGLRPGMSVYIQGTVPRNAKRFRVDFAHSRRERADILFHFNPRFDFGNLVLNTFQGSWWGDEKSYEMPFQKGKYFEVIFIVTEAGYQIIVNKKPLFSFRHRMPPQRAQVIRVKGDLVLQSLTMMGGPVMENTTLPCHHSVPGGLHPRTSVFVQGTVPEHSNRTWMNFRVDFACGQHEGADLPLHFNPRFYTNKVVLNTFRAGSWREEEKHRNPFRKGEHFEILFIVTGAGYQILVNGNHLCSFRHRMPAESVQDLSAQGDLELRSLVVMRGGPVMRNVGLPYHHSVPGGLRPGMAVYLEGTVLKHIESLWLTFQVEFACGQHKGADLPLHFEPRFMAGQVLLNTFQAGRWGKEKNHPNPFRKGEPFEITFIVNEAEYQILVNGTLVYTYKHVIQPQSIQVISASGHLELQSLTVMGRPVMGNTMMTNPAFYYPVPYTGNIPGGLGVNSTITVRGSIPKDAERFEISLMAGQELALSINPRMQPWRCVARNSLLNNQWGAEEHNLPFNPFQPGKFFELSILCDNHQFKVYTNSHHLFDFAYRYVPLKNIDTIKITGNVTLSYIKY